MSAATRPPKADALQGVKPPRESVTHVYNGIRSRILSGDMVGGEVVSQVQLAHDFDVSRGPVREAMRMLQNEGLVRVETNQRSRVATFTAFEMEQVCALLLLNVASATLAGADRFTDEDWEGIVESIDRIERFAMAKTTPGATPPENREARADRGRQVAFRQLIGQLSHYAGPYVVEMIGGFLDRIGMFRQLHESGHGHTPYPLSDDFTDLRTSARARDSHATARCTVDKVAEVSRKALAFVDADYHPTLLDSYVTSAHSLTRDPSTATDATELVISVRSVPGEGLSYTVRG